MPDPANADQQADKWLFKSALAIGNSEPLNDYRCATPGCPERDDRILAGYEFCDGCMDKRRKDGAG